MKIDVIPGSHGRHDQVDVPGGDVLVHAGDGTQDVAGGGGGYYGGGGGAGNGSGVGAGGAGGGSSYIDGLTGASTTSDVKIGNGETQITYTISEEPPSGSANPIPTLSVWGLGILAGLLGLISFRRRMK